MGSLRRLRVLAVVLVLIAAACSESPANAQRPPPGVCAALGSPLIGHDGHIMACSGKNLVAFERNGSTAWIAPLGHTCKEDISPVAEGEEIYLVAEDKVIKITPKKLHTADPPSEVFFSYNSTPGRSEEIIGLATSGVYSSLLVTIRNRGLFSFSLRTGLQWSAGPMLAYFDCRLGCKTNISGCYFISAPVVDQWEETVYLSNTEGKLYSLYIRSG
uniref:Uncharacterized protein n=1 Tax=Oryza brachyantha TaxID=4533 RepID=J3L1P6_ORYBR